MAQDEGELIRLALEQLPDGVVMADAAEIQLDSEVGCSAA